MKDYPNWRVKMHSETDWSISYEEDSHGIGFGFCLFGFASKAEAIKEIQRFESR